MTAKMTREQKDAENHEARREKNDLVRLKKTSGSVICKYDSRQALSVNSLFLMVVSFIPPVPLVTIWPVCCLCLSSRVVYNLNTGKSKYVKNECTACRAPMHAKCKLNYIKAWKAARIDVDKATRARGKRRTAQQLQNAREFRHPECPMCRDDMWRTDRDAIARGQIADMRGGFAGGL
jgi:hypothetical protein